MDIHQLVSQRDLILGGVHIPHHKGLLGHSDADALLHAIAEAIIGALALGDLGTHFPDTSELYRDVDSKLLLKEAFQLAKVRGYEVNNLDATIMTENPKMAPYVFEMKTIISSILETDLDNINIKATRGEKIGFIGREEGILCDAVILLIKY
jgi:2-C-methyl-D-erythritol 2,4-cyclodiphosphate synthase